MTLTHREIGDRLGLSEQRVMQIERAALRKLMLLSRGWEDGPHDPNLHESQYERSERLGRCRRCHQRPAEPGRTRCAACVTPPRKR